METPTPNPIHVPEKGLKVSWALGFVGCLAAMLCAAAGIIAPILSSSGQSINTNQCMDNLRRISAASFLYAKDNNDTLPAEGWHELLAQYEEDEVAYACPAQRRIDPRSSGYAISKDIAGKQLVKIENQEKTPLYFDSKVTAPGAVAPATDTPRPGRHRNQRANNVAYVDGHVETIDAN